MQLDIQVQDDWLQVEQALETDNIQFSGVIMRTSGSHASHVQAESSVNLIHCMPLGAPEEIFKHLTVPSSDSSLLVDGGWIVAYGPWLNDDGSYKSQADQEVG